MSKFRNEALKAKMETLKPKTKKTKTAKTVLKPDTVNKQGYQANSINGFVRLMSMLNTLKLENQFYRTETQVTNELKTLIGECAKHDPYFTAQCIVYSRCVGEGMRSINHLAATLMAPHLSGADWGKRFYSLFDKKHQKGGTIFRPDDISEIVAAYSILNKRADGKSTAITNAMKKGFKEALENMDTYALLKYKPALLDIINIVHPNPNLSKAKVKYKNKNISVFEAIIKGYSVSADTWEVAQSDAGQIVAKAVKEGKLSVKEAEKVLKEAKAENWGSLLVDGKLGVLAALRNIRNVLNTVSGEKTIQLLCTLLSDGEAIRKGKVMPYQIDLAHEVLQAEFARNKYYSRISSALQTGYECSLPNLAELLHGNNLVMVDMSGSMTSRIVDPNRKTSYVSTCMNKAALLGATIAKATNADIIRFGTTAEYVRPNLSGNVFTISKSIQKSMGGTSLAAAWKEASKSGKKYDRVFIFSDNECNTGNTYSAYKTYTDNVGEPYVYSVDLASYGTIPLAGPKVRYYYGFGTAMFDDVATSEFNPMVHLEKAKKIVI